MSGGHFDYDQHRVTGIAESIQALIDTNDDSSKDEWDEEIGRHYPPEIVEQFKAAVATLRLAAQMAHNVDYLVCDDYGSDTFLREMRKLSDGDAQ
jgi:hypothetical protein